jgi:hypothetical protein
VVANELHGILGDPPGGAVGFWKWHRGINHTCRPCPTPWGETSLQASPAVAGGGYGAVSKIPATDS